MHEYLIFRGGKSQIIGYNYGDNIRLNKKQYFVVSGDKANEILSNVVHVM